MFRIQSGSNNDIRRSIMFSFVNAKKDRVVVVEKCVYGYSTARAGGY